MSRLAKTFLYLFGLALVASLLPSYAQESPPPDSVQIPASDTLAVDSLRADTSATPREESGVDTLVFYTAEQIDFDVERRISVLLGSATVTYKEMRLEAGRIEVNWDAHILTALPIQDSLYLDSARTELDTVMMRGRPHFIQGTDDFFGDEIAYNLKTKIGRVRGGSTNYEDGFYYGQQFKRVADDVITVRKGEFTTCTADTPHYHFAARTLKILVKKRVIARPVILLFDDVPVLAAPYGVFPQQHGRTSGILVPTFGESSSQGRFLRDIGYYWAISDYMDLRTSIDYFERFGLLGRGALRYTKRYTLNGETAFDFNTQRQGSTQHRDFSLASTHTQTIDRNTRLAVSARYVSSESYNRDVGSIQDQLRQSVLSNATLSRGWETIPWSMSANVGYTQNIRLKTWSATLPQIQFSHKSGSKLFPPPKAPRGVRGARAPRESLPPWYRTFTWSYSMSARNELSMPLQYKEEGLRLGLIDLYGRQAAPTKIVGTDKRALYQKDGLSHTGGLSATARVLKYVNLNPSLSLRSTWSRLVTHYRAQDKILDREDQHGFFTRTTFSMGGSATTKLYGLANRPLGIGASFRHVMTPTAGFTYRPDFSKPGWGYYHTATLPDGRRYTYDRWANSIDGATPKGLSERFNFGLDHLFQMKTGDAEADREKQYDLLAVTMGTAVDIRRDSLRWDNLGMSYRTMVPGTIIGPIQNLGLDLSTVHSLYQYENRQPVRRFFWDRENAKWYAPLELVNAGINISFSARVATLGELLGLRAESRNVVMPDSIRAPMDSLAPPPTPADVKDLPRGPGEPLGRSEKGGPTQLYQMPLSMSFSIHQNRDYINDSRTSAAFVQLSTNLTPRWNVDVDYSFDLDRRRVNNVGVQVTRDLHCWDASFSWSPLGYRPGYFLRIGLKSAQLRDVKIERHRGAGLRGYY